jgi:hypothetical protein
MNPRKRTWLGARNGSPKIIQLRFKIPRVRLVALYSEEVNK